MTITYPAFNGAVTLKAEEEEFLWRIGPLNCYNPMKPDRDYDLDLTHRDEREVCKASSNTIKGFLFNKKIQTVFFLWVCAQTRLFVVGTVRHKLKTVCLHTQAP